MSRDKKLESRVNAYLAAALPGSKDLLAILTDASMRAFEDMQDARPPQTVKRSDITTALTQCIGIFSVARDAVYQKVAATTMTTMPLNVVLGKVAVDRLVALVMVELERRFGLQSKDVKPRPIIVLLD